jgi:site-specific DNA-methyltransferase (adenine-specific)
MSVICGDSLHVLPTLDAESVDAIVCDPPYGLSFMGKDWDHGVPGEAFWREALRVAKPGAHLVAFGGTRTYHRLAVAIEDAGWEIRDCLSWLYGSGFPKSLDVGKAIDKAGGGAGMPENDRILFAKELRAAREAKGMSRDELAAWFPQYSEVTRNWERLDAGFRVPSETDYNVLVERLGVSESWRLRVRLEDKRRLVSDDGTDRRDDGTVIGLGHSGRKWQATTDLARQWQGWGTALKPAWEPVILARKPLIGTVAANVAQYGTGGINVDGCRIGTDIITTQGGDKFPKIYGKYATCPESTHSGRWPANVCLDEEAAGLLDAETGTLTSGKMRPTHTDAKRNTFGQNAEGGYTTMETYGDSGGASRFFYVSKASRKEREAGLEGMPEVNPFEREGPSANFERMGSKSSPRTNSHPCVKPISLMRWLCRLVTPKGGLILDPFTGSGTTGCAAVLEGFRFVGVEREPEYAAIAEKRIAHWAAQTPDADLFTEAL